MSVHSVETLSTPGQGLFFVEPLWGLPLGPLVPLPSPCFPAPLARMPQGHIPGTALHACLHGSLSPENSSCGTRDCPHPLLSSPESQAFLLSQPELHHSNRGEKAPRPAFFSGLTSISLQWHTPEQMRLFSTFRTVLSLGPVSEGSDERCFIWVQ